MTNPGKHGLGILRLRELLKNTEAQVGSLIRMRDEAIARADRAEVVSGRYLEELLAMQAQIGEVKP